MSATKGQIIRGKNWDYTIVDDYNDNIALITALGGASEENWLPENNHKLYEIALYAEIEAMDASNPTLVQALKECRFIAAELIAAINEQGIYQRSKAKIEEHFSIQIQHGEYIVRFVPLRHGQVYDRVYPDFWFAAVTYLDRIEREYVIDSRHFNEKAIFDLITGLEDEPFVVQKL